jgi:lipid A disaccharide synthetase
MQQELKLMIVVGETSGDSHAADLVREIRETERAPNFSAPPGRKCAMPELRRSLKPTRYRLSGSARWHARSRCFLGVLKKLKEEARRRKPDASDPC